VLGLAAFILLAFWVNVLAATLAISGLLFYVFVYTLWLKRWTVVDASRSFDEMAGLSRGRSAWKCCATCFRTKPTIAARCACSRISSDSHCRTK